MPYEMQLILAGLFGVFGLAVALYATFVLEAEALLRNALTIMREKHTLLSKKNVCASQPTGR